MGEMDPTREKIESRDVVDVIRYLERALKLDFVLRGINKLKKKIRTGLEG